MTEKQNRTAQDGDGDGLVQDGTEFERPEGFVIGATDGDGDGLVQDGTKWERPVEEASVAPEPAPAPKVKARPKANTASSIEPNTVVSLGALVYKANARNSMSVRAVQTRLLELDHLGAGADLPGWLADGTMEALTEFHSKAKIEGQVVSLETLHALFKGLPVTVVD